MININCDIIVTCDIRSVRVDSNVNMYVYKFTFNNKTQRTIKKHLHHTVTDGDSIGDVITLRYGVHNFHFLYLFNIYSEVFKLFHKKVIMLVRRSVINQFDGICKDIHQLDEKIHRISH